jgi:hypothetical protein
MTTIDMRKIATLARAGLTDEQIDQVCALFPPTAPPTAPPPEPPYPTSRATSALAEAERAEGQRSYHGRTFRGRVTNARIVFLAEVKRGPKTIENLASSVYKDVGSREIELTKRYIMEMAKKGLVKSDGKQVTAAPKAEAFTLTPLPAQAKAAETRAPFTSQRQAAEMRADSLNALCEAIRSDVVRAGGHTEGTLHELVRPHRRLLDAACVGLPTTSVRPLSALLSNTYTPTGVVFGGLRWMKGPQNSHLNRIWVVAAV